MAKKLVSDVERLARRLEYDEKTDCWVWAGRLDKDGYAGQVKVGSRTDGTRRQVRAHRFIYALLVEPIPEGLVIDHLCRNRACQNPFHMEPVTPEENTKRGERATKTHCHRGHPLTGENLRRSSLGGRICRICFREYQATYQKANGGKHQKAYRMRLKEKMKSDSETA